MKIFCASTDFARSSSVISSNCARLYFHMMKNVSVSMRKISSMTLKGTDTYARSSEDTGVLVMVSLMVSSSTNLGS